MALERLPFELAKPSSEEFVTQSSQIGHNGQPLDKALEGLDNISKESTQFEEDAIIYETDEGAQVGKIGSTGADFIDLKRGGQQVAIMSDLPTKDSSVGDNPSTTHVPTTKAVKDYVDANAMGDLPISKESTQSEDEEFVASNDAGTDTYARVGSYGVKAKAYKKLNGDDAIPPLDSTIGDNPSNSHTPSTKAVKDYVDENASGNLPIEKESTYESDESFTIGNDAGTDTYMKVTPDGVRAKAYFDRQGNPLNFNGHEEVDPVDNLVATYQNPLEVVRTYPCMASIFHRFAFIGDSLCSGETYGYEGNTRKAADIYAYSWGMALCRLIGAEGYCYSNGGQTACGWVYNSDNTHGYVHSDTINGIRNVGGGTWMHMKLDPVKDCYIIALGENDINRIEDCAGGDTYMGFNYILGNYNDNIGSYDSVNDVDDNDSGEASGTKTFVGCYAGIIQRIQSIQPQAKIFCVTDPRTAASALNEQIRGIVSHFSNCYCIDLAQYAPDHYSNAFKNRYFLNGHMSAAGYQYAALEIMTFMDWIIRNNWSDFRDVALVGTGWSEYATTPQGEGSYGDIV